MGSISPTVSTLQLVLAILEKVRWPQTTVTHRQRGRWVWQKLVVVVFVINVVWEGSGVVTAQVTGCLTSLGCTQEESEAVG